MTHELYKTKEEIENWLNYYGIDNYILIESKEYGYVVDVNSNVDFEEKSIKEIKIKFNIINGNFDISCNLLKSLKGCPEIVNDHFWCNDNQIENLEYLPKVIKKEINIANNKIKSLKGCPEIVKGDFWCLKNNLKNLKYCPKIIYGIANFESNEIKNLEYFPINIIKECLLKDNHELGNIQNVSDFKELKKIHDAIVLNKKLEEEMKIYNKIKSDKIKL